MEPRASFLGANHADSAEQHSEVLEHLRRDSWLLVSSLLWLPLPRNQCGPLLGDAR